MIFMVS